jgi:hypothetical protein
LTLVFLFRDPSVGEISYSLSPTPLCISSAAAMLEFKRTYVVLQEKRLEICCILGKVMYICYYLRTHDFHLQLSQELYGFSGKWVAGLVARWQDYAATPISQFLEFLHMLFPPHPPA